MLLELSLDLGLRHSANDLPNNLAALEDEERWDGADAVLLRYAGVVIDVELAYFDFALVLGGQCVDGGCNLLARPTPHGPEVDESGHVGVENLSFEAGIGEFEDVFTSHFALIITSSGPRKAYPRGNPAFFLGHDCTSL